MRRPLALPLQKACIPTVALASTSANTDISCDLSFGAVVRRSDTFITETLVKKRNSGGYVACALQTDCDHLATTSGHETLPIYPEKFHVFLVFLY
jgi:hypothetical protein